MPERVSRGRPVKTRILIVGEGKTEKEYFYALKQEDGVHRHFAVTVKNAGGFGPEAVVKVAIRESGKSSKEYDEVWCVLDVETRSHRESLNRAVALAKNNKNKKIKPVLSNPCFEVWILAHFEKTARAFIGCSAVEKVVNKHWKREFGQAYKKGDDPFGKLVDRTAGAIANARWVRETHHKGESDTADCNSSTDAYRLVEYMFSSPDAI
ncbi:RloB domain-containing protein [bacterium]|nr:RloB domain-containing protein [bacterium]